MIKTIRKIPVSFDIIILTYNSFYNTQRCLEAIYSHSDDFGLVVLDNASTDGTRPYLLEMAAQKKNISLYFSEQNLGIVNGRIKAYEISLIPENRSKWICFLDNDQFVDRGWINSYFEYLKFYDVVGFEGWKMRDDFYPYAKAKDGETYNYVGCGGMMLKREIVDSMGLFDEQFNPMFFEDPDFCFRAYDAGYKICWNPESRISHQSHRLLGSQNERAKYFRRSWDLFRKKWNGRKLPLLSGGPLSR